ncbi:MAG: hydantoinase B/oxoprolinase family protein [Bacteroidota bacterium]
MGHWKIWADTGGTFTDCIATSPEHNTKRIKLLSDSSLKGTFRKQVDSNAFKADFNWDVPQDIFADYELHFPVISDKIFTIEKVDLVQKVIYLTKSLPTNFPPNTLFSITAYEEAPVMAARMATGTTLKKSLPPLEMRVGSTRGTNALLERKGAKTALLITKGFEDLMEIGDQTRPDIFSLNIKKALPLYGSVIGVDERINADGNILNPLSQEEITPIVAALKEKKIDTVAISFIHSYLNSNPEKKLKDYLSAFGITFVSCSSELAPSIKFLSRTGTALINAYLAPIIHQFIQHISEKTPEISLKIMTSAGGMTGPQYFQPKDSLLSGPAGGIVGAVTIAKKSNIKKIITLDMGGTSTDVARYDDGFDYQYETTVGGVKLMAPSLAIHTVAAGGGSVCQYDGYKFFVGPESAGAFPGPASYGNAGPLSITDINLLLGRIDPLNFGIPLCIEEAEKAFTKLIGDTAVNKEATLAGFLQIANEKMAEAIRKISISKGYNPSDFTLLAFGGAGGQHACNIATLLNMHSILVPYDAGLLSAYGMGQALIERFATKQLLKKLATINDTLPNLVESLFLKAKNQLKKEGFKENEIELREAFVYLRFSGQNHTIEVPAYGVNNIEDIFYQKYKQLYGYLPPEKDIEIESLKVVASNKQEVIHPSQSTGKKYYPKVSHNVSCFIGEKWRESPVFIWEDMSSGAYIKGPALLVSNNSTLVVEKDWELQIDTNNNARLGYIQPNKTYTSIVQQPKATLLELFTNRFKSIAENMGALLQRTALSVNIKERLDFSCALLDSKGYLVVNAPHIPVHLGSMGLCVRKTISAITFEPGDVVITNHPAYGGSHLPDITLIAGVFNTTGKLIAYVANRAHHSEIGGISPGSFPVKAKSLAEEGVVISPTYLVKKGKVLWNDIKSILKNHSYPSRAINENLADLNASLAAINTGKKDFEELLHKFGEDTVRKFMQKLKYYAASLLQEKLKLIKQKRWHAKEKLDDGTIIQIAITKNPDYLQIDFTRTSLLHKGNLNATEAITRSVVIYVLRLWVNEDVPLNEGLMQNVKLILPVSFINPEFERDASLYPAVAGGNTETSQRITDTILKALGLVACSQGTMNNLLFGNQNFGYYETIGGGSGAGDGFNGASGVHQHMTNTRITDPEILELKYPVRLEKFALRKNSGGKGKFSGGEGIERQLSFLQPVELTLITQHRVKRPYGMNGGKEGASGEQYLISANGEKKQLPGIISL